MMITRINRTGRFALPALALCAALAATGCQRIVQEYEFQRGQTVALVEETGLHRISPTSFIDGAERLADQAAEIRDAYARFGTGALHLAVSAPSMAQAEDWGAALQSELARKGFNTAALVITPIAGAEAGAVITYRAVDVLIPDCGTGTLLAEPGVNSGCAIERQIGMMVARPADLAGRGGVGAYAGSDAALAAGRMRAREHDDRPRLLDSVPTTDAGAE